MSDDRAVNFLRGAFGESAVDLTTLPGVMNRIAEIREDVDAYRVAVRALVLFAKSVDRGLWELCMATSEEIEAAK
jgi:hypothetical protein